jgi:hypothetical protein
MNKATIWLLIEKLDMKKAAPISGSRFSIGGERGT